MLGPVMDSASRSPSLLGSLLVWMRVFQLLVSSEWFDAIMTLTRWRSQYLHLEGVPVAIAIITIQILTSQTGQCMVELPQ